MQVAQVTNLALQSELFLRAWCYGTGFTVRHYLPDYLSLCGATFSTSSLVHVLILPMSHKDLKRVFEKSATARSKRILKIGFRTIAAYLLLLAHPKFDNRILKNRQLVHFCMEACNNSVRQSC